MITQYVALSDEIAGDVSAGHDIARYANDIRGNNGQR